VSGFSHFLLLHKVPSVEATAQWSTRRTHHWSGRAMRAAQFNHVVRQGSAEPHEMSEMVRLEKRASFAGRRYER